jgi:ribosomal protein S21
MPEVIVRKGEPIDRALKRLKSKLDAEGILDEVRRPARVRDANAEDATQSEDQRSSRQKSRSVYRPELASRSFQSDTFDSQSAVRAGCFIL